ncbi:MAG: ABC transporter permease [Bacteroidia bacterium]|nr:ABC transporter permease [Bacteroidia bacterium]
MFKHLIIRSFYPLSILWGVITLCFILFYVFPDADELVVGQRSDLQTKQAIKEELGLDKPAFARYIHYLKHLSPISVESKNNIVETNINIGVSATSALVIKFPDFGLSYQNRKPVVSILLEALVGTLTLAGVAMLLAFFMGIVLGTIAALNYNSIADSVILAFSTLFISIPSFFSSILIAWLFGFVWHQYTGLPMTGSLFSIDLETGNQILTLENLVLPALALAVRPVAVITQLMRSSLLGVLQSDYIRTAKAKGLSPNKLIVRHALKNALNPVITAASGWFASMMAGAFFVEYIFNWKGLGKVLIESVQLSDLPVVSGGVIYIAIIFIAVNSLVNISYQYLDPKLKK